MLLTTAGLYGQLVLETIARRGVRLHGIVLMTRRSLRDCFRYSTTAARFRELPAALARWLWRRMRHRLPRYQRRAEHVLASGPVNSPKLRRDLEALAPDLLVLGGSGILDRSIIATARAGVLNCHPALLPWVRGSGVVGWSLDLGIAVGATCHYVDERIDAGAIVERRLLRTGRKPIGLRALEAAAAELAAELLADVVAESSRTGSPPSAVPQDSMHPLRRWYSHERIPELDRLARSGWPGMLFERWLPLCQDMERCTLPPGPLQAPAPPVRPAL